MKITRQSLSKISSAARIGDLQATYLIGMAFVLLDHFIATHTEEEISKRFGILGLESIRKFEE